MMLLIADPLLPTLKRSLIQDMVVDGNVWWVQILGVFSPILRGLSYTLLWRLSISSSSKEFEQLLLLFLLFPRVSIPKSCPVVNKVPPRAVLEEMQIFFPLPPPLLLFLVICLFQMEHSCSMLIYGEEE